jgi:hypothetical protein
MSLYSKAYDFHFRKDLEGLRNYLQEQRKTDPVLDTIINGKSNFSVAASTIEKKFSDYQKTRKEPALDEKFNEMVAYTGEALGWKKHMYGLFYSGMEKKEASKLRNRCGLEKIKELSAISFGSGTIMGGMMIILNPEVWPLLLLTGIGSGLACGTMASPLAWTEGSRDTLIRRLKSESEDIDRIINEAYAGHWHEKVGRESTGKSLVDAVAINNEKMAAK